MTKIEISPADIRKGDLIRYEWVDTQEAREYVAKKDGGGFVGCPGKSFLLDRPEQPFKVGTVVRGVNTPDKETMWVRGGPSWVTVSFKEARSVEPYVSNLTDKHIRNYLETGHMKLLSEPA